MFRAATAGVLEPPRADAMLDDAFDAVVARRRGETAMLWEQIAEQLHAELAELVGIWRAEMLLERVTAGVRVALRFGLPSSRASEVALVVVGYPRRIATQIAEGAEITAAAALDLSSTQTALQRRLIQEGTLVAVDPRAPAFAAMLAALRGSGAVVVVSGATDAQRELARRIVGEDVVLLEDAGSGSELGARLREIFAAG
jgi:hypothetical protein